MSNLIDGIRKYVLACPFLNGGRVNVDYIGTDMGYSIDPLPCDPIVQRYIDGGAKKQFQFAFTSQEEYDQDARINIENSGFYQQFEEWLEEKTFFGEFPYLGKGKIPVKLETLNSGYLYDVNGENAKYRIECRLIFIQEV
nr:MAG TPA: Minor capsid protein from bacteriophage [Caudoviricetes sp.]